VAGILSALAEAGLAKQVAEGNAHAFQLSRPEPLRDLLGANDLAYPAWRPILSAVLLFLELASFQDAGVVTRRVEANNRRERLRVLADRLWLNTPPVTRGDPAAWEALLAWATAVAVDLANGTSAALGVRKVRAAAVDGGHEVWVWLHWSAVDHARLSAALSAPHRMTDGMSCTAVSPVANGWTSFQLTVEPPLDEVALRGTVAQLVSPMTVAWRQVEPGSP